MFPLAGFNSISLFQYSIVYISMCLGVSLILFVLLGISLRVSFTNYGKYLTINLLKISSLPIFLLYPSSISTRYVNPSKFVMHYSQHRFCIFHLCFSVLNSE